MLSVALVRGHPGLSGERWCCEGEVCSVVRRVGVWVLGLVCSAGLVQRSPCLQKAQSFTATPPIARGHLSESFNYISPLLEWNLLEIKDSLTHVSSVNTPILYQESCSALGIQRQVNLDPVLLGCLPWSRDFRSERPFKYSGFTSGPFISVKKI